MHNHVTGLDHVVIAVRDLAAAAAVWTRLGFAVTPKGVHPEWGTANHCVMFGQDYIELLAAEGEGSVAERIRAFTASREGMIGLAFASDDGAASVEALRRAGLEVPEPRSLSRRLEAPGQPVLMFSEVPLPLDAAAGLPTRLVSHITAERERNPAWLDHGNGAIGVAAVTAVVGDPGATVAGWDRLFGPHAATPTDNTVTVHTGRGLIFLTTPDDLTQLHPEADLDEPPPPPALVALALQVVDTARAAAVLTAAGIAFSRDAEGTIRIAPAQASGVFLELMGG
ncbi:MAG: VOC family protein [Magnetospirillum sp.]|nr:VOC family protein [Magnetospirillum sp.]